MRVRPLAAADVPALAAALAELPLLQRYRRDQAALASSLGAALARGEGLLAAEAEGRVAGLCWYLPSGTLGMGAYLKLLAVAGDAQRAGTGARLLEAFEAAVALESRHAFLLVSDFNQGARRFYERRGYARVGAIPGLVLPDVAELVYWKRLR
jgi:ribosomal protein S18 acetylase RimI-like enzyme